MGVIRLDHGNCQMCIDLNNGNPEPLRRFRRFNLERQAMKRTLVLIVLVILLGLVAVWAWNHSVLQGPLEDVLSGDPRNKGIEASAHFDSYVDSSGLVFDIQAVDTEKSPADVFRVLLQFAEAVQGRSFERIVLAHRGKPKFQLEGSYFRQLGQEYSTQNPVFTMRTFPEHLERLDGTKPFGSWTGGLLGVVKEQLNDFGDFHKQWYVEDMEVSPSP